MRTKITFFKFIVFILCCFQLKGAAVSPFEATFFDVGQGHFTLVRQPNIDATRPSRLILVDCGSSTRKEYTADLPMRFAEKINKYVGKRNKFELDIIMSHADEDHYNLVYSILDPLKGRVRIGCFLLGGNPTDWALKARAGSDVNIFWQSPGFEGKRAMNVYSQNPGDSRLASKIFPGGVPYWVFPNITPENYIDVQWNPVGVNSTDPSTKNDRSVVVYFRCHGRTLLLTGDATKRVTEAIAPLFDGLRINLLQIAHHGADEGGCNDAEWLARLGSSAYVISSGLYHSHPQATVIETCENLLRVLPSAAAAGAGAAPMIASHDITYHKTLKKCKACEACSVGRICSTWVEGATPFAGGGSQIFKEILITRPTILPVYHTHNQGDICIKWGVDGIVGAEYTPIYPTSGTVTDTIAC